MLTQHTNQQKNTINKTKILYLKWISISILYVSLYFGFNLGNNNYHNSSNAIITGILISVFISLLYYIIFLLLKKYKKWLAFNVKKDLYRINKNHENTNT